jgi:tetratricopeptide (TPR) repeat protein
MAFTRHSLGELYRAQGRTAEAITCFKDCLGFFREFGFGLWEATTLRSLGAAALLATGDTAAARTVLRAALKILRDCQAAGAEEVALQLHKLPRPVDSA